VSGPLNKSKFSINLLDASNHSETLIREAEEGGYIAGWRDYVQGGEDGAYYLDYLFDHTVTEFAVGNPEGIRPEDQIEAHRKMIQNAVAKEIHQKNERVKQKYIWLALYHNSTMKRLQERISSENFARFTIPEYLLNF